MQGKQLVPMDIVEFAFPQPVETACVAFMHIPKTSGFAVYEGIIEALKPSSLIIALDSSLFGDFDAFETVSPEMRRVVRRDASEFPRNAGVVLSHIALST